MSAQIVPQVAAVAQVVARVPEMSGSDIPSGIDLVAIAPVVWPQPPSGRRP